VASTAAAQDLVITTMAATSQGGPFLYPAGIAVDSAGNLYVADTGHDVIDKVTPTGVIQVFAGQSGVPGSVDGTGSAARFNQPYGLAVDPSNNVYVADMFNDTIRKITPSGTVTTIAGIAGVHGRQDGPGLSATFYGPWGLAIDSQGNLYTTDNGNGAVRKISTTGIVSTLASSLGPGQLMPGIAADPAGNVYVSMDPDEGIPETPPPDANLIEKITPAGVVTVFAGQLTAGSADGTGSSAQFSLPMGMAMEPSGNLLVADANSGTVREITPPGAVTTVAGTPRSIGVVDGVGSQARLYGPTGIAVDAFGNVFITDSNGTLRRGIRAANTPGPVRLLNLSARGQVSPGMPLITGFSIQGPLSETLLIRAIGPTLQQFGLTGTLPNPQLDLYAQGGVRIASSANGMNTTSSQSAGAMVGAFPLPANGGDAAIVMTLSPGLYTAQATSPTGASGNAMLEVYEIP
jgi:sugar lactone lactonase YvrE